ncbi:Gfo/Idh/MocA family protein [Rhizocola hellebori]|uniref:Gfo/Idh/MocA family protein n=1 Tax=Rhizocola hellebori TaxID=1392758 RepID=UPI001941626F
MANKIRWGVLATGGIATRFVNDLKNVPDAEVVAVGSRTAETAVAFQEAHGIPRAHGSWAELAHDPDVDIIYIATPHSHHHAAGLVCLHAGKPLLVEKAFTLDLAQAQDLVTVARERQLFLMEAMWTRTLPSILRMLELIADGAIGQVTSIHAGFGLGIDFDPSHRLRNPQLGGGALLDLGVYPIHFTQLLLGSPTHVHSWAHLHPEGTDARTGIVLGFANGEVATLYCGVGGDIRSATVVGTKGRFEFTNGFHNAAGFTLHRNGSEPETITTEPSSLHFQAAEAGRCLRAGLTESPLVPLSSTLSVMHTLDAVRAQIGVVY